GAAIEAVMPWCPLNEGVPPEDRMLSSAIASSSPVVIPARTSLRSSSSVRPTTRPAVRIARICSRVLISIPRSLNIIVPQSIRNVRELAPSRQRRLREGLEGGEHALADLVDLADAVHLDQQPTLGVHLQQR